MPSYKFYYFTSRGRGELCRYLFTAAGQHFEDVRFDSVDIQAWADFKPSTPFGQIPLLDVDGKKIAQSGAIARYLAREFNLCGKDSWEAAQCDQFMQLAEDLRTEYIKAARENDEEKRKAIVQHLNDDVFPKFLAMFECALEKNGGVFFVGDGLSVADLAVYAVFDTPMLRLPNLMEAFPKMKAHRTRLESEPKMAEYIKNRKPSDR